LDLPNPLPDINHACGPSLNCLNVVSIMSQRQSKDTA